MWCRSEIEALNNKLFESGAASIAGLKANLARATAVLAATGDGREEVSASVDIELTGAALQPE